LLSKALASTEKGYARLAVGFGAAANSSGDRQTGVDTPACLRYASDGEPAYAPLAASVDAEREPQ
jgi:hypothetical protein